MAHRVAEGLSLEWRDDFLGGDVLLAVRAVGDVEGELFAEEAALVERAVGKRRRQFAAGRVLARELLGSLGVPAGALLRGDDRVPLWPEGVRGTISHTDAVVMAAVARVGDGDSDGDPAHDALHPVRALGLDVEHDTPLEQELWATILTDRELRWLDEQPETGRGAIAKRVFSAKESVYKAQYHFSRTLFDFRDVELVMLPDAPAFEARLPEHVVGAVGRATLAGRWWRGELCGVACVVTGVVVRDW